MSVLGIRLRVITWNVGGSSPPEDLTLLLGLNEEELPDLYAIGLQRVVSDSALRITDDLRDEWATAIHSVLSPRSYFLVKGIRDEGICLSIYIRKSHLTTILMVESNSIAPTEKTGAIAVNLRLGCITVCFVNCRLSAKHANHADKMEQLGILIGEPKFKDVGFNNVLDQHYVFLTGYLNSRILSFSNEAVRGLVQGGVYGGLLKEDELNTARRLKMLGGFNEGEITFPPTFKFDVGTDQYDTSVKNRTPAWCDRILWRTQQHPEFKPIMEQKQYTSLDVYKKSGHKPVVSKFTIKVKNLVTYNTVEYWMEGVVVWTRGKEEGHGVTYLIDKDFSTTNRDWVGLFPENFSRMEDGVRACVPYSRTGKCKSQIVNISLFDGSVVDKLQPGKYKLYYYSDYYKVLRGPSKEVEIR